MQAGARREHPAGENPLHLALKGDLIDLDEGIGIGGFGRGPRVASVGLHPQRAELHGFADILVEVDDAAGDLVEAGEDRLLVDDLLGRRLGDDLVAWLQRRRCRRSRARLVLSGWQRPVAGWVKAARRQLRPAHSAEPQSFRVAAAMAGSEPDREVERPALTADASAPAARVLAAADPAPLPRHLQTERLVHAEWRPADAARDPKKYCRFARARAMQPRPARQPQKPHNRL